MVGVTVHLEDMWGCDGTPGGHVGGVTVHMVGMWWM